MNKPRYVEVTLTERQWDVVRDALYRRGTIETTRLARYIWIQGGGVR